MKTICIYHSLDLDGWMSAAIVKHYYNSATSIWDEREETELDFIGYTYGQPIPDLSEYDKVIMCDISFPKEEMLYLAVNKDFTWIDHHISAIKDNDELIQAGSLIHPKGRLDTTYAACELTWQYFFPNEAMPEIVRLLGRYDCFGHKGTDEELKVLEFQYGFRQRINNYEIAYEYLTSEFDYNIIHNEGKVIYQYLCTEAKQIYKHSFEIILNGYKFASSNNGGFNASAFNIHYTKDGYDGYLTFSYSNSKKAWTITLRSETIDVSIIAKQYGGGGHKGASGFVLTQEQFNNLIK